LPCHPTHNVTPGLTRGPSRDRVTAARWSAHPSQDGSRLKAGMTSGLWGARSEQTYPSYPRPQILAHTAPIFPGYGRRCSDRCPARRSGGWRSRSALGCADGAFGHGATVSCWGLRSAFREKPDAPRRRSPHSLLPIEAIAASGLRSFTHPRRRRRRPALAHARRAGLGCPRTCLFAGALAARFIHVFSLARLYFGRTFHLRERLHPLPACCGGGIDSSLFGAGFEGKHIMAINGTVKFFNSSKSYGFIQPDEGSADTFVQISAVE